MVKTGLGPDFFIFTSLIEGYCMRGQMDMAREVFEAMKTTGPSPNLVTYNTMLDGYCKNFQLVNASDFFYKIANQTLSKLLFRQMGDRGCEPDFVTYNILIQGLIHNPDYDMLDEILEEMARRDFCTDLTTRELLLKVGLGYKFAAHDIRISNKQQQQQRQQEGIRLVFENPSLQEEGVRLVLKVLLCDENCVLFNMIIRRMSRRKDHNKSLEIVN
ncbi:hypothetical protein OSB04_011438 [Centaurea solstitialis]|uniref:Pentatricopeptide repeat-containing protein n=1 Tax=Centaurea solstitialis TaxID=347529 RepID=A0AA38TB54_9ASTR|nr:hypothetical protein OSB04_011438 [Centaurea solstitialis]